MKKAENFNQDIHVVDYRLQYEENRATAETLMSIEGREIELLNGPFHFSPDPYETCLRAKWFKEKKISDNGLPLPIDSDFEGWPTINVP
ncbi:MAG: glycoside hydrolase family 2, partial [Clostridia bacterium]|nr:glycoside hydrolase family 2 [Clostridia bacterium]